MFGHARLYLTMLGCVWSCTALFGHVRIPRCANVSASLVSILARSLSKFSVNFLPILASMLRKCSVSLEQILASTLPKCFYQFDVDRGSYVAQLFM